MTTFASLHLPEVLLRGVTDMGFEIPTPIQLQAIPPALEGRDLLACAMTGSGKTAAFLLPMLARLGASQPAVRKGNSARALILSPTRELAAQTDEQLKALAKHTRLRGASVFGGVSMKPQEHAFRSGFEVIVATPGRLLDHLQHDYARLDGVEILVLDEADRMLDMGFLPDIRRVLSHLPKERQNLLFSATMPPPIATLAREMMKQPVQIAVDRQAKPATGVTQAVFPVAEGLKTDLLIALLQRDEVKNLLVFTRTKHRANRLAERLTKAGVPCERIHGNRSQNQRTEALARFKSGDLRVLVATDIAARGIDVEALSHVVNFDVPNIPEDYIHRVGRTARAEATGDAWTFLSEAEANEMNAIERAVGRRIERVRLEGFDYDRKVQQNLEIPIGERIAEIRARKAEERARAKANAERRAKNAAAQTNRAPESGQRRPAHATQAAPTGHTPQARPHHPGGAPSARPNHSGGQPAAAPSSALTRGRSRRGRSGR
jgi:ATP-dependent RNA helicase RhlE